MADMRDRFLFLTALGALSLLACAASNGTTSAASAPSVVFVPEPAQQVEVANVEPAPEIAEAPPQPVPDRPDEEQETIPLTGAWAVTFGHNGYYADAMKNVQSARAAYAAAAKPIFESDGGVPPAPDFQKANALLDLLNRRFAAAYYAPNATIQERIAVLEEAASTLLRWSQRLDDLGMAQLPATYRTDHRVALTFEEVVQGPAKRWRSEGFNLAGICVTRARTEDVDNAASKSCKTLHDNYAHLSAVKAPPKSKAPAECACNPGDPLCSATMSGWCRPR